MNPFRIPKRRSPSYWAAVDAIRRLAGREGPNAAAEAYSRALRPQSVDQWEDQLRQLEAPMCDYSRRQYEEALRSGVLVGNYRDQGPVPRALRHWCSGNGRPFVYVWDDRRDRRTGAWLKLSVEYWWLPRDEQIDAELRRLFVEELDHCGVEHVASHISIGGGTAAVGPILRRRALAAGERVIAIIQEARRTPAEIYVEGR